MLLVQDRCWTELLLLILEMDELLLLLKGLLLRAAGITSHHLHGSDLLLERLLGIVTSIE